MIRKVFFISFLIIPFGLTSSIILFKTVPGSSTLSSKGELLLENELLEPWRKKLGEKKELVKFSRCPQGISYRITTTPTAENPNFEGKVIHYNVCDQEILCYFQITENEEKLHVKLEEKDTWSHPSVIFRQNDLSSR